MAMIVGVVDRSESESGMQNRVLQPGIGQGVRAATAHVQARFSLDAAHALTYLSAATNFNISQVVDIVKGVHAKIRVADCD